MSAVVLENMVKWYGKEKTKALNNVSFEVSEGELFGLIGPDGAGKSSIFRILTTLILPDDGKASVMGRDVVEEYKAIRSIVGYMPGKFSLYQDLTVEENLHFFATVFGTSIEANYELIREIYVFLEPFKDRPAGKLSGGMKQKLALCCALIHQPEVLFLDEPTTGVDPVSRKEFWDMLKRLKSKGITVLVSTPYMDEASLCDRVALIHQGHILAIDTPFGISKSYPFDLYELKNGNIPRLLKLFRNQDRVKACYSFGDCLHLSFEKEDAAVIEWIHKHVDATIEVRQIEASVEDSFMAFIN
ncbi:MAG: ABC transporter ATP-binding protein [Bacteroidetes bacterium]|nr:ABC transporter ATP-binding protein [Bacteroidota bacterium]